MSIDTTPLFTKKQHLNFSDSFRPFNRPFNLSWNYVLTEDYCHNQSILNLLQSTDKYIIGFRAPGDFSRTKPGFVSGFLLNDAYFQAITSIDKYHIEGRYFMNNRLKLFLEAPVKENAKDFRKFMTIALNKNVTEWKLSGGVILQGTHQDKLNYKTNTRLSLDQTKKFYLNLKQQTNYEKYIFLSYAKLNLSNFKLLHHDITLGYQNKNYDIYLQKQDQSLGNLTLNFVYRYQKFSFCSQLGQNITFGLVYRPNNNTVFRAKIDERLDLTAAVRHKIKNRYSIVLGTQWNLSMGSNFVDISHLIPFPIGYRLEANF